MMNFHKIRIFVLMSNRTADGIRVRRTVVLEDTLCQLFVRTTLPKLMPKLYASSSVLADQ
jgi:hypothetical protein